MGLGITSTGQVADEERNRRSIGERLAEYQSGGMQLGVPMSIELDDEGRVLVNGVHEPDLFIHSPGVEGAKEPKFGDDGKPAAGEEFILYEDRDGRQIPHLALESMGGGKFRNKTGAATVGEAMEGTLGGAHGMLESLVGGATDLAAGWTGYRGGARLAEQGKARRRQAHGEAGVPATLERQRGEMTPAHSLQIAAESAPALGLSIVANKGVGGLGVPDPVAMGIVNAALVGGESRAERLDMFKNVVDESGERVYPDVWPSLVSGGVGFVTGSAVPKGQTRSILMGRPTEAFGREGTLRSEISRGLVEGGRPFRGAAGTAMIESTQEWPEEAIQLATAGLGNLPADMDYIPPTTEDFLRTGQLAAAGGLIAGGTAHVAFEMGHSFMHGTGDPSVMRQALEYYEQLRKTYGKGGTTFEQKAQQAEADVEDAIDKDEQVERDEDQPQQDDDPRRPGSGMFRRMVDDSVRNLEERDAQPPPGPSGPRPPEDPLSAENLTAEAAKRGIAPGEGQAADEGPAQPSDPDAQVSEKLGETDTEQERAAEIVARFQETDGRFDVGQETGQADIARGVGEDPVAQGLVDQVAAASAREQGVDDLANRLMQKNVPAETARSMAEMQSDAAYNFRENPDEVWDITSDKQFQERTGLEVSPLGLEEDKKILWHAAKEQREKIHPEHGRARAIEQEVEASDPNDRNRRISAKRVLYAWAKDQREPGVGVPESIARIGAAGGGIMPTLARVEMDISQMRMAFALSRAAPLRVIEEIANNPEITPEQLVRTVLDKLLNKDKKFRPEMVREMDVVGMHKFLMMAEGPVGDAYRLAAVEQKWNHRNLGQIYPHLQKVAWPHEKGKGIDAWLASTNLAKAQRAKANRWFDSQLAVRDGNEEAKKLAESGSLNLARYVLDPELEKQRWRADMTVQASGRMALVAGVTAAGSGKGKRRIFAEGLSREALNLRPVDVFGRAIARNIIHRKEVQEVMDALGYDPDEAKRAEELLQLMPVFMQGQRFRNIHNVSKLPVTAVPADETGTTTPAAKEAVSAAARGGRTRSEYEAEMKDRPADPERMEELNRKLINKPDAGVKEMARHLSDSMTRRGMETSGPVNEAFAGRVDEEFARIRGHTERVDPKDVEEGDEIFFSEMGKDTGKAIRDRHYTRTIAGKQDTKGILTYSRGEGKKPGSALHEEIGSLWRRQPKAEPVGTGAKQPGATDELDEYLKTIYAPPQAQQLKEGKKKPTIVPLKPRPKPVEEPKEEGKKDAPPSKLAEVAKELADKDKGKKAEPKKGEKPKVKPTKSAMAALKDREKNLDTTMASTERMKAYFAEQPTEDQGQEELASYLKKQELYNDIRLNVEAAKGLITRAKEGEQGLETKIGTAAGRATNKHDQLRRIIERESGVDEAKRAATEQLPSEPEQPPVGQAETLPKPGPKTTSVQTDTGKVVAGPSGIFSGPGAEAAAGQPGAVIGEWQVNTDPDAENSPVAIEVVHQPTGHIEIVPRGLWEDFAAGKAAAIDNMRGLARRATGDEDPEDEPDDEPEPQPEPESPPAEQPKEEEEKPDDDAPASGVAAVLGALGKMDEAAEANEGAKETPPAPEPKKSDLPKFNADASTSAEPAAQPSVEPPPAPRPATVKVRLPHIGTNERIKAANNRLDFLDKRRDPTYQRGLPNADSMRRDRAIADARITLSAYMASPTNEGALDDTESLINEAMDLDKKYRKSGDATMRASRAVSEFKGLMGRLERRRDVAMTQLMYGDTEGAAEQVKLLDSDGEDMYRVSVNKPRGMVEIKAAILRDLGKKMRAEVERGASPEETLAAYQKLRDQHLTVAESLRTERRTGEDDKKVNVEDFDTKLPVGQAETTALGLSEEMGRIASETSIEASQLMERINETEPTDENVEAFQEIGKDLVRLFERARMIAGKLRQSGAKSSLTTLINEAPNAWDPAGDPVSATAWLEELSEITASLQKLRTPEDPDAADNANKVVAEARERADELSVFANEIADRINEIRVMKVSQEQKKKLIVDTFGRMFGEDDGVPSIIKWSRELGEKVFNDQGLLLRGDNIITRARQRHARTTHYLGQMVELYTNPDLPFTWDDGTRTYGWLHDMSNDIRDWANALAAAHRQPESKDRSKKPKSPEQAKKENNIRRKRKRQKDLYAATVPQYNRVVSAAGTVLDAADAYPALKPVIDMAKVRLRGLAGSLNALAAGRPVLSLQTYRTNFNQSIQDLADLLDDLTAFVNNVRDDDLKWDRNALVRQPSVKWPVTREGIYHAGLTEMLRMRSAMDNLAVAIGDILSLETPTVQAGLKVALDEAEKALPTQKELSQMITVRKDKHGHEIGSYTGFGAKGFAVHYRNMEKRQVNMRNRLNAIPSTKKDIQAFKEGFTRVLNDQKRAINRAWEIIARARKAAQEDIAEAVVSEPGGEPDDEYAAHDAAMGLSGDAPEASLPPLEDSDVLEEAGDQPQIPPTAIDILNAAAEAAEMAKGRARATIKELDADAAEILALQEKDPQKFYEYASLLRDVHTAAQRVLDAKEDHVAMAGQDDMLNKFEIFRSSLARAREDAGEPLSDRDKAEIASSETTEGGKAAAKTEAEQDIGIRQPEPEAKTKSQRAAKKPKEKKKTIAENTVEVAQEASKPLADKWAAVKDTLTPKQHDEILDGLKRINKKLEVAGRVKSENQAKNFLDGPQGFGRVLFDTDRLLDSYLQQNDARRSRGEAVEDPDEPEAKPKEKEKTPATEAREENIRREYAELVRFSDAELAVIDPLMQEAGEKLESMRKAKQPLNNFQKKAQKEAEEAFADLHQSVAGIKAIDPLDYHEEVEVMETDKDALEAARKANRPTPRKKVVRKTKLESYKIHEQVRNMTFNAVQLVNSFREALGLERGMVNWAGNKWNVKRVKRSEYTPVARSRGGEGIAGVTMLDFESVEKIFNDIADDTTLTVGMAKGIHTPTEFGELPDFPIPDVGRTDPDARNSAFFRARHMFNDALLSFQAMADESDFVNKEPSPSSLISVTDTSKAATMEDGVLKHPTKPGTVRTFSIGSPQDLVVAVAGVIGNLFRVDKEGNLQRLGRDKFIDTEPNVLTPKYLEDNKDNTQLFKALRIYNYQPGESLVLMGAPSETHLGVFVRRPISRKAPEAWGVDGERYTRAVDTFIDAIAMLQTSYDVESNETKANEYFGLLNYLMIEYGKANMDWEAERIGNVIRELHPHRRPDIPRGGMKPWERERAGILPATQRMTSAELVKRLEGEYYGEKDIWDKYKAGKTQIYAQRQAEAYEESLAEIREAFAFSDKEVKDIIERYPPHLGRMMLWMKWYGKYKLLLNKDRRLEDMPGKRDQMQRRLMSLVTGKHNIKPAIYSIIESREVEDIKTRVSKAMNRIKNLASDFKKMSAEDPLAGKRVLIWRHLQMDELYMAFGDYIRSIYVGDHFTEGDIHEQLVAEAKEAGKDSEGWINYMGSLLVELGRFLGNNQSRLSDEDKDHFMTIIESTDFAAKADEGVDAIRKFINQIRTEVINKRHDVGEEPETDPNREWNFEETTDLLREEMISTMVGRAEITKAEGIPDTGAPGQPSPVDSIYEMVNAALTSGQRLLGNTFKLWAIAQSTKAHEMQKENDLEGLKKQLDIIRAEISARTRAQRGTSSGFFRRMAADPDKAAADAGGTPAKDLGAMPDIGDDIDLGVTKSKRAKQLHDVPAPREELVRSIARDPSAHAALAELAAAIVANEPGRRVRVERYGPKDYAVMIEGQVPLFSMASRAGAHAVIEAAMGNAGFTTFLTGGKQPAEKIARGDQVVGLAHKDIAMRDPEMPQKGHHGFARYVISGRKVGDVQQAGHWKGARVAERPEDFTLAARALDWNKAGWDRLRDTSEGRELIGTWKSVRGRIKELSSDIARIKPDFHRQKRRRKRFLDTFRSQTLSLERETNRLKDDMAELVQRTERLSEHYRRFIKPPTIIKVSEASGLPRQVAAERDTSKTIEGMGLPEAEAARIAEDMVETFKALDKRLSTVERRATHARMGAIEGRQLTPEEAARAPATDKIDDHDIMAAQLNEDMKYIKEIEEAMHDMIKQVALPWEGQAREGSYPDVGYGGMIFVKKFFADEFAKDLPDIRQRLRINFRATQAGADIDAFREYAKRYGMRNVVPLGKAPKEAFDNAYMLMATYPDGTTTVFLEKAGRHPDEVIESRGESSSITGEIQVAYYEATEDAPPNIGSTSADELFKKHQAGQLMAFLSQATNPTDMFWEMGRLAGYPGMKTSTELDPGDNIMVVSRSGADGHVYIVTIGTVNEIYLDKGKGSRVVIDTATGQKDISFSEIHGGVVASKERTQEKDLPPDATVEVGDIPVEKLLEQVRKRGLATKNLMRMLGIGAELEKGVEGDNEVDIRGRRELAAVTGAIFAMPQTSRTSSHAADMAARKVNAATPVSPAYMRFSPELKIPKGRAEARKYMYPTSVDIAAHTLPTSEFARFVAIAKDLHNKLQDIENIGAFRGMVSQMISVLARGYQSYMSVMNVPNALNTLLRLLMASDLDVAEATKESDVLEAGKSKAGRARLAATLAPYHNLQNAISRVIAMHPYVMADGGVAVHATAGLDSHPMFSFDSRGGMCCWRAFHIFTGDSIENITDKVNHFDPGGLSRAPGKKYPHGVRPEATKAIAESYGLRTIMLSTLKETAPAEQLMSMRPTQVAKVVPNAIVSVVGHIYAIVNGVVYDKYTGHPAGTKLSPITKIHVLPEDYDDAVDKLTKLRIESAKPGMGMVGEARMLEREGDQPQSMSRRGFLKKMGSAIAMANPALAGKLTMAGQVRSLLENVTGTAFEANIIAFRKAIDELTTDIMNYREGPWGYEYVGDWGEKMDLAYVTAWDLAGHATRMLRAAQQGVRYKDAKLTWEDIDSHEVRGDGDMITAHLNEITNAKRNIIDSNHSGLRDENTRVSKMLDTLQHVARENAAITRKFDGAHVKLLKKWIIQWLDENRGGAKYISDMVPRESLPDDIANRMRINEDGTMREVPDERTELYERLAKALRAIMTLERSDEQDWDEDAFLEWQGRKEDGGEPPPDDDEPVSPAWDEDAFLRWQGRKEDYAPMGAEDEPPDK